MKRPILPFVLLAAAMLIGGHVACNAALRAVVYQCVRSILRGYGVH